MSRSKGHLRLVDPLPEEPEPERFTRPTGHPSTWHWPDRLVDRDRAQLMFQCPVCEQVYYTDRVVLERWCTGNSPVTGARTHVPTEMDRIELSD